jgi:hypothetical protein
MAKIIGETLAGQNCRTHCRTRKAWMVRKFT